MSGLDRPSFQIIAAKRQYCSQIACAMRDQHREAVLRLGLDPYQEIVAAFDETVRPIAWMVGGEFSVLGGVAGPHSLCPVGLAWLVVTEGATRFPCALVKEVKRQLDIARRIHPMIVAPIVTTDARSIAFAAFLGFDIAHSYLENGLRWAVYDKGLREAA
jgi:hypothetical protein